MSKSRILIVAGLCMSALTFTMCCKQNKTTTAESKTSIAAGDSKTVKQGITGKVEVWEGNFMPAIDKERSNNKITPGAGRRVRVHEPFKYTGGGMNSSKRETIPTPIVAEVMADSAGRFAISVPPGKYSIFVEDEGGWYNNGFDGQGVQGAVSVNPDTTTEVLIKITTKATF